MYGDAARWLVLHEVLVWVLSTGQVSISVIDQIRCPQLRQMLHHRPTCDIHPFRLEGRSGVQSEIPSARTTNGQMGASLNRLISTALYGIVHR